LKDVVAALCEADLQSSVGARIKRWRSLPSRDATAEVMTHLRAALFPRHFGSRDVSGQGLAFYVGRALDVSLKVLEAELRVAFAFEREDDDREAFGRRAAAATSDFATRLPTIRRLLASDAQAGYDGDPAATSIDEVIFSYAGMTAVTYHRIAHELHRLGVPLIPRIISELAHASTGIDIHPGAQIGGRFFIDHGTGVVVGETCRIGDRVRLYQGVTLGAKSFPSDEHGNPIKGIPRHPIVEDDVTIYAGATVLGRITIGRGSSIGGNVWLTHSVQPNSHVSQGQAREQILTDGGGI
jgi:serine O-acetyltransferase